MRSFLFFIGLPIFFTTAGEFFLKIAINDIDVDQWLAGFAHLTLFPIDAINTFLINVVGMGMLFLTTPLLLISVTAIFLGGLLWLGAMTRYELSFLYPFLSINYVSIVVGSQIFLNESVSLYRYISVVFIIIGLIILSRSPYAETNQGDNS